MVQKRYTEEQIIAAKESHCTRLARVEYCQMEC